ncbi:MAG: hypothetical protein KJO77_07735 [Bacteroidia bacterium]|nr:hypothetical protein [Bacteroidia bacterium]NND51327.1 hypothetical protein [Flavobacteriaceae bacterium]
MIKDHTSLLASAGLVLFFFIAGLLDILDNPVIKILMIAGFVVIVINIILTKSRDDDEQKNLPD